MKLKILPLLLFCPALMFAQDSTFQLKDYKYRTPGFRALFIQLNASGSLSEPTVSTGYAGTDKRFSLSPSEFGYTRIISTDKRLHQSMFSLLPSYNYSSNEEGAKRTYDRLNVSFDWTRNDRFYKSGGWFLELGNQLTLGTARLKQTDTAQWYRQSRQNLENTLTLGIGKGRVERVQDAQMALFILNDLSRQDLLSQPATYEQAYAFAQLITDINNRRVFDTRRRRIYELTRIDSFLQSSGLAQRTDIRHFTTVNDNWAFAINPFRLSGSHWYLRLQPGVTIRWVDSYNRMNGQENKGDSRTLLKTGSPVVGHERYVPKSLKWQLNMGASLSYAAGRQDERLRTELNGASNESETVAHFNTWATNAFYGLGFFPNNRTQLTGTLNLTAIYQDKSATSIDGYIYVQPSLNIAANYFLGYRTYLTANLYANYTYNRTKISQGWYLPSTQWATGAGVSFSHIIF